MDIKTVEEFEAALKNPKAKHQVIDFWAEWCGPCKRISPVLESVEKTGAIQTIKVNIDDSNLSSLVEKYRVRSIPLLVIINTETRDEKSHVGTMTEAELIQKIKDI